MFMFTWPDVAMAAVVMMFVPTLVVSVLICVSWMEKRDHESRSGSDEEDGDEDDDWSGGPESSATSSSSEADDSDPPTYH